MTDPIASIDQLETALGRELSGVEESRADLYLRIASDVVRSVTGHRYSTETHTWQGFTSGAKARLLPLPVASVTSVVDSSGAAVTYTLRGDTVYVDTDAELVVTFTAGHSTAPDLEVGIVCQMAIRALSVDPGQVGYTSETIDGYNYGIGSAAAAAAAGMLPGERAALKEARFAPSVPIRML